MNTLDNTKGAAMHATFGSVSDWLTSFPRTIFVVQTKIFYFDTRITHKMSFWLQKLSDFRRFFSSPKKPKNAGCFGKNAECGKVPNLRDFPHDCGMVDTYAM